MINTTKAKQNILSFGQFLETYYGISWDYFDNNYSDLGAKEIYDDYDYYCDHPEEY